MTPRWTHRPEGSTWGDWGPDDQLGRVNLLTPEKVLEGLREVREGRVFCLSLPLDFPGGSVLNPRRHPPQLQPTLQDGCPCFNFPMQRLDERNTDLLSDDQVTMALQYSTQWDSFAHVGSFFDVMGDGRAEKVYYNGFRAGEHVVGPRVYEPSAADAEGDRPAPGPFGARSLDISNFAVKGMQGRAVMVDLKRHFGMERRAIGLAELRQVIDADGIDIRPGDMVVLRTGFTEVLMAMDRQPDKQVLDATGCVLDGRDTALLQWVSDSRISALCADNYAVEGLPARAALGRRPALPLHQHCLFKLGVPLAELWWLADLADWLAARQRTAFLLTAPPLRLPGAVGSPVTPIATV
jgi:kynurenine formamidase